jgi:hypothetical protein
MIGSRKSAFKPWTPKFTLFNGYEVFMELAESGEIKMANKDGTIMTPCEAVLFLEMMYVKYQNGVLKVIKK